MENKKECLCLYHDKCEHKINKIINKNIVNVCNYFKFYCEYCVEQQ